MRRTNRREFSVAVYESERVMDYRDLTRLMTASATVLTKKSLTTQTILTLRINRNRVSKEILRM